MIINFINRWGAIARFELDIVQIPILFDFGYTQDKLKLHLIFGGFIYFSFLYAMS